jgi:hypothetical protein
MDWAGEDCVARVRSMQIGSMHTVYSIYAAFGRRGTRPFVSMLTETNASGASAAVPTRDSPAIVPAKSGCPGWSPVWTPGLPLSPPPG